MELNKYELEEVEEVKKQIDKFEDIRQDELISNYVTQKIEKFNEES